MRSHRSPPSKNVRSRRSTQRDCDYEDSSYRPYDDRSSPSYSNESTDSRRSRSRSWDSKEEFGGYRNGEIRDISPVANKCRRRLTERPIARSSSNNRSRRPISERLGPVESGHPGAPVNVLMPLGIDLAATGHGPLTREIRRYRIPRDLRKPPNLNKFDGRGDPDKHLRYFNNYCSYRELSSIMKCRLFPQSLDGRALEWWESMRPNTISSWEGLVATFLANYTANRCQYRYEEHLDTIVQGENESLRAYIDRFNSEAETVRDLSDRDRLKYLKRGIRQDHRFAEEFTLNHYHDLGMFLRRANDHMSYEERLAAKGRARPRPREEQNRSGQRQDSYRDHRSKNHEQRTVLNAPVAQIYKECQNSEFVDVQRPAPLVLKKGGRSTNKYCRYHRSKGHDTNDCMTLKNDIEDLIQKGRLRQYVGTGGNDRSEERFNGQPDQDKDATMTDQHGGRKVAM